MLTPVFAGAMVAEPTLLPSAFFNSTLVLAEAVMESDKIAAENIAAIRILDFMGDPPGSVLIQQSNEEGVVTGS